ncbi:anti-sigma factor RsbA family regulatory protein [Pseudonocardia acaciae]|uniref:anti-sigma factor RsbA family regulatory protein n=1 Tax=Pseudonocardia acaciae TaxID=551276 RepID=UPI000686B8AA|nr:anti-sigma factor RsbA family regulatory protein [Pseudonocardia acaciae]
MRFENTRTALPRLFTHRAAYYTDAENLLAVAVPLVEQALRQEMPVALIVSPQTERRLREALGSTGGLIHMPPPEPWLRGSGQAVVTQRARELRELTDWAGPVTVVAEHHPHRPGVEPAAWIEADAALNVALASLPITMTCLYPTGLETKTVTAAVQWNHPHLIDPDGTVRDNPDVRQPSDVLVMYPVNAPARLGAPDRELSFTPWQLIELRSAVGEATEAVGLRADQAEDFVLAVNEVASNAVEHGYGVGQLQMWQQSDRLVCEVHDGGTLDEPLPGLRPPHPSAPRGRGIWIARQLCDLLHVWSDAQGTHVRLQAARN